MDDLALEVARLDDVEVDDPERADARRGEVQRRRAAEPARADHHDLRLEELDLARGPDLGDQQVPAVARLLGRRQARGRLDGQRVRLPLEDAAGQVDDVCVAELLELGGAPAGSRAAAALHDDLGVLVGHRGADLLAELAERDEQGARDVACVPFDLLAHVDQGRPGRVALLRLRGADLTDGGLHRSSVAPVGSTAAVGSVEGGSGTRRGVGRDGRGAAGAQAGG